MATEATTRTRDELVKALMSLETKRPDLFEKHAWECFAHFMMVYHMETTISKISREMPAAIREGLAA